MPCVSTRKPHSRDGKNVYFPGVPLEEWFGRSRAIREGIIPIVVLVLGPQKGLVVGVEGIDGVPPIR